MITTLLPAALAALLAAAPASAEGRVLDRVAALVNGDVVTLHDLEERAGSELVRVDAMPAGPERDRARASALRAAFDALVSDKLMSAQIKELGVEVTDAEVDSVIADIKRRNSLDDARLDQALAAQGYDRPTYRSMVKRDLESMRLVQLKVRSKVKVTDEDIQNYWQTHPQEFRSGEEVKLRHIFLAVSDKASAGEQARVQAAADEVAKKLRGGADFAALARKVSQGPSAADGGELGWLQRGTVQPEVDRVAFALERGAISDPIRTPTGFQIVQVEDKRGGTPRPLADVKEDIRDRLTNQQGDVYRAQYLADLRKDAAIEIKLPELQGT